MRKPCAGALGADSDSDVETVFQAVLFVAFSEAFAQAMLNPTCEVDIGTYAETYESPYSPYGGSFSG